MHVEACPCLTTRTSAYTCSRPQVKSTLVVGALVDLLHSMLAGTRRKMLHGAATGNWGGRDASDTLAAEIMGNDTLRRELFPALVRAYASLDQVYNHIPRRPLEVNEGGAALSKTDVTILRLLLPHER